MKFFRNTLALEEKYSSTTGAALPPTLKSQYELIYNSILQSKVVLKELIGIITSYALSVGYKTDFRESYFNYSPLIGNSPTFVSYEAGAPDFQNALLDFSFRGRCMIRFTIHSKGDEMWLGVTGHPKWLDEDHSITRGAEGQWAFYCGLTEEIYHSDDINAEATTISRAQMLGKFKPVLNISGNGVGPYGSFHFPKRYLHSLVPCNTGDVVDIEVDAQEKIFTVFVNGNFQASSKADDMPDQLAFFVQLDATDDQVEFEILEFSFEKNKRQRCKKNDSIIKYLE